MFFGWGANKKDGGGAAAASPQGTARGGIEAGAATAAEDAAAAMARPPGFVSTPGVTALVTGSSGLCGARLVELLLERGAKTVVCLDIAAPDAVLKGRWNAAVQQASTAATAGGGNILVLSGKDGDITSDDAVAAAFTKAPQKIDVVYHIAALVGPFFDYDKYDNVNFQGTLRIIDGCRRHNVPVLVYSSSPSTRFTGGDVMDAKEEDLIIPAKGKFMAMYAETKAAGEKAVTAVASETLKTVSVAPHQVYGPYDNLAFPNLLSTAANGNLRIFGNGRSIISVCYVDNYCHGLLCAADALFDKDPTVWERVHGKFYIVTDGEGPVHFWKFINQAVMAMGFDDLYSKFHLPVPLLYALAYLATFVGNLVGKKFKLNPFNVWVLTVHRYFNIDNARRDLKYEPIVSRTEAWNKTIVWFREYWLPEFVQNNARARRQVQRNSQDKRKKALQEPPFAPPPLAPVPELTATTTTTGDKDKKED